MIVCCKTCYDHELKEDFHASENEVREMRTLCFYSWYLFHENKPLKMYSNIIKEDHDKFKTQPRLWKSLNQHSQATLQHYLDSPLPEIISPAMKLPELDDSTSSSFTVPEYSTQVDKDFKHIFETFLCYNC